MKGQILPLCNALQEEMVFSSSKDVTKNIASVDEPLQEGGDIRWIIAFAIPYIGHSQVQKMCWVPAHW